MNDRAKAFWFQLVPLYVIGFTLAYLASSHVVSIPVGVMLGIVTGMFQDRS